MSKRIDRKFEKIGFIKRMESMFGVMYQRDVDDFYTHTIYLGHKIDGQETIESSMGLRDTRTADSYAGLTMYETKLCIKKMKSKGWKVKKGQNYEQ